LNFPFFVAKRYLFSKKSHNVVNIITGVSLLGVLIGTAALVISLSAASGLNDLIKSLYNTFDPDIKITAVKGKVFDIGDPNVQALYLMDEIENISQVIEEDAVFKYRDRQIIATIKGVDDNFVNICGVDTMMYDGQYLLTKNTLNFGIVGSSLSYQLGIQLNSIDALFVYLPNRFAKPGSNPLKQFIKDHLLLSGIFRLASDFDSKYIIAPIRIVRKMMDYDNKVSALEIKLKDGSDIDNVQQNIKNLLGDDFTVKNRFQQKEVLYKVMQAEKLGVFVILFFILFIATFNIIGTLLMLIIEKKSNISTMIVLGASKRQLTRVFFIEGWLVVFIGSTLGILLGLLFCYLQQKFHFISLDSSGSFIIDYYPVKIQFLDILSVIIGVNIIGVLATLFPIKVMVSRLFKI